MNQALNTHLSDVGLLAPSASPTPSEESHPRLRYHLSHPAPICTILSSLGGSKALLVPQGFVLLMWHQVLWEKASCTLREDTPYEPGFGRSLKRCRTFGLLPHPHAHIKCFFVWIGDISLHAYVPSHLCYHIDQFT